MRMRCVIRHAFVNSSNESFVSCVFVLFKSRNGTGFPALLD